MPSTPVHVFARWKIKEGKLQAVLKLLGELGMQTRNEKGNLFYRVHQSKADANTLLLSEGYIDEAAQKAHTDSEHFQLIAVNQIIPMLSEREVFLTIPIEV